MNYSDSYFKYLVRYFYSMYKQQPWKYRPQYHQYMHQQTALAQVIAHFQVELEKHTG